LKPEIEVCCREKIRSIIIDWKIGEAFEMVMQARHDDLWIGKAFGMVMQARHVGHASKEAVSYHAEVVRQGFVNTTN